MKVRMGIYQDGDRITRLRLLGDGAAEGAQTITAGGNAAKKQSHAKEPTCSNKWKSESTPI